MKTTLIGRGAIITATLVALAGPAFAQIRVLDQQVVTRILPELREVDFEDLPLFSGPHLPGETQGLPSPLTVGGITLQDPRGFFRPAVCTSPTCQPDPDNTNGVNIELFLDAGGSISFPQTLRVVVLDIQGMGDDPFTLVVTDGSGEREIVTGQGVLYGVALIGLASPAGISSVAVQSVGGSRGPLVLARVLFAETVPNNCPEARVLSDRTLSPAPTNIVEIANCKGRTCLHLDGSMSSDADGDPLNYRWLVDDTPFESLSGAVTTICLETGRHEITLTVDDGLCLAGAALGIEVITPRQAVERLIEKVIDSDLSRRHQRSLIVTLKAAANSFARGNFNAGRWQLSAFIHQVRAQVLGKDADLANDLVVTAQEIIRQVDCGKKGPSGSKIHAPPAK